MPNIETVLGNVGESLEFAGDVEDDQEDGPHEEPHSGAVYVGESSSVNVIERDLESGEGQEMEPRDLGIIAVGR